MAVFEYAINNLGVNNILITGHSRCGGVKASMSDESVGGVIGRFLSPVHELYTNNKEFLESIPDETERDLFLVELNIKRLVRIVSQLPIVKERWKDGKMLSVHGWIYRLETGELEDLGVTCTNGLKFDTEYLPELEAMGINL
ncbi:Carbonic anhydrase 2 [Zancudomyces culisetae]|nr:Carbonic anhydrase 2 [Zancudomyces culisetae]|eukprot:OMH80667.1 Carbonic anhydrase 2 [Zancudomyces culisetae]